MRRSKATPQTITPDHPDQRLTVHDLAAILRRSRSGIWAAVARGDLPVPERYGRRCTRWRWGDVQEHLSRTSGVDR